MICVFPDPYPDEILYSVCARYKGLMNYPDRVTATRDFFGPGSTAVVDLPNRIDHLYNALPPGHLYSSNEIARKHTHYSFYARFLPSGRAQLVLDSMRAAGTNRIAERIGLTADRLAIPNHLRFCPSCVENDRKTFGETYWHRIHQVPCIDACPDHAVFLEDSSALWRNSRNPGEALPAEGSVNQVPPRLLDSNDYSQAIQLKIACFAAWLLNYSENPVGSEILRLRYYNLLLRQGLAYYNGDIRTSLLTAKFLEFFPSQLLKHLGCEIRNPYSNWLTRILHPHKAEVAQHPIRHILFLIFVGGSPNDIFQSFAEFRPFGLGPWPCLNHASGHYATPQVISCVVTDGMKRNKGKPVGTFRCVCGFVYTRTGPDSSDLDRLKSSSVRAYGSDWEQALREHWNNSSITCRSVAQKLGVNVLTAKRRAINLGLTFPRARPSSLRCSGQILDRYRIKSKPAGETLNIKRKALSRLVKDNPQSSRTNLQRIKPGLVDWLRRWDREWLEAALPKAKAKFIPRASVGWEERDEIFSRQVEEASLRIYSVANPPERVSLTAVIKVVGHRAWIEKKLNEMPRTSLVLAENIESFSNYTIRRIRWAAESFRKEGVQPSRAMLAIRGGARGRLTSTSAGVLRALTEACKE